MIRILAGLIALLSLPLPLRAEGSLWNPIGPYDASVFNLAVDPVHPGVLFGLNPDGVLRSLDSGNSWTLLAGSPAGGLVLAVDPSRPRTLYAADSQRLFKSTDGGDHWVPLVQGLPFPLTIMTLAIDPSHPARLYLGGYFGGIWRSTDGGASWKPASRGLPFEDRTPITAAAVPRRPSGTAFALVPGASVCDVYKTANGGFSWMQLFHFPDGDCGALAVAPSEPRTLFVSLRNRGLYWSTDGGASWTPATGSALAFSNFTVLAVDPRSARTVYAGTPSGLIKTTDGGRHWEPIGPSVSVGAVALDPRNPDIVYAGVLSTRFNLGGVWRSKDGGRHWQRRSDGILGLDGYTLAVDAGDPDLLLVGNSKGIFRTANGGRRWSRTGLGPPLLHSVVEIVASPVSGTFLAMAKTLWMSADGGESWIQIPEVKATLALARFDPGQPDTVYVMTRAQLFRGTFSSGTWTRVAHGPMECGIADFAAVSPRGSGAAVLYVAGTGTGPRCSLPYRSQILRSTDGGMSWASADAGLPGEGIAVLATDPEDPDVLYAGIAKQPIDPVPAVWKSRDGGASWAPAGEELLGASVARLLVVPAAGHVWAATREGQMFRSTDGGATWQEHGRLPHSLTYPLALDPQDPRRIFAGTWSGVWVREEAPWMFSISPGRLPMGDGSYLGFSVPDELRVTKCAT